MLKISSKKANLSLFVAASILGIVAFVIFRLRPVEDGAAPSSVYLAKADGAAQVYQAVEFPVIEENEKTFGSSGAPLSIFVYEDYTNIFSANLADSLNKAQLDFGEDISISVRPFVKNSQEAFLAALAVECAGRQDKWKEMRALLFAKVKNRQNLEPTSLDYQKQLGLDEESFSLCLTNEEKSGKMEEMIASADALAVYGAPTIFIGEEVIPGARPYEDYTDSEGNSVYGLKTVISAKLGR